MLALATKIVRLDTPKLRETYRSLRIPRSDDPVDIDRRYRWDLYWSAHTGERLPNHFIPGLINREGLENDEFDVVLRWLVPEL